MQVASGRGPVRYKADVRRAPAARRRARARSRSGRRPAGDPASTRCELTGGPDRPARDLRADRGPLPRRTSSTRSIPRGRRAIRSSHFLLRSKAGHCEYFASAAAMMLDGARHPGAPRDRLLRRRGGLFSARSSCAAQNLHAWVEADLDGTGFAVLDPTPAAGIPPATDGLLAGVAARRARPRDRVLLRPARSSASTPATRSASSRRSASRSRRRAASARRSGRRPRDGTSSPRRSPARLVLLLGWPSSALLALRRSRGARPAPPRDRAYLALRRLLAARLGRSRPPSPRPRSRASSPRRSRTAARRRRPRSCRSTAPAPSAAARPDARELGADRRLEELAEAEDARL